MDTTAQYDSLKQAGVINERGEVDAAVRDWMTVLGRADSSSPLLPRIVGLSPLPDPVYPTR